MKQKFSFEEIDSRAYIPYCKESLITENKRLSPDYSSVLQNQNNNLIDTNQLSWLQKFAEDNQKICSSGLFDENIANQRAQNVTNEMKFSFNMNYNLDDRRKEDYNATYDSRNNDSSHFSRNHSTNKLRKDQSDHVLLDIKNTENIPKNRNRKDSLPGSIKRNQKIVKQTFDEVSQYQRQIAQNTPMSKLDQMNEKLNRALQKDRSSSLLNLNNKQNVNKDSMKKNHFLGEQKYVHYDTDKFEDSLKYYQRSKQVSLQPKKQLNYKQNQNITYKQSSINNHDKYLQYLFGKLDKNQTGKLTKANCHTQLIPEQFKFIFGNTFTKVKFQQFVCNKKQFTKLCENTIKELGSNEVLNLLINLPIDKQLPNNSIYYRQPQYTKNINFEEWEVTDETKKNYPKNAFETQQSKQFKKSISKLENTFKLDSKIQSRMNSSLFNQEKSTKTNNQSIRKYNEYEKLPLKKQAVFDETFTYSSKNDLQFLNKNQLNDTYSKKFSNISENMIEQHKRGLDNLNRLNKRMQCCLNTNILTQHNKQGLLREDNLTFHELIKHV